MCEIARERVVRAEYSSRDRQDGIADRAGLLEHVSAREEGCELLLAFYRLIMLVAQDSEPIGQDFTPEMFALLKIFKLPVSVAKVPCT